jgi:hypothetical protein
MSRHYTALVRGYGLQQEFITPHCPEQNGLVERVIRTIKEQCVHRHRFETLQHASRVLADWIQFVSTLEGKAGVEGLLRTHGAELIGETVQYEDKYRLCYLRGPAGIIVALAEELF